jgi:hypothetical protein
MVGNALRSELLDDVFFTRWSEPPTPEATRELEARMTLAKQRARGPLIHVAIISGPAGASRESLDIDPLLRASQPHAGVLFVMVEGYTRQTDGTQHAYLVIEGPEFQALLEGEEARRVLISGTPIVTRIAHHAVRVRQGLAGLAADLGQRLKWDGEDLLRRARERGLVS